MAILESSTPKFRSFQARMNSFGSETLRFPLYDPRSVREDRKRFRREAIPMLEYANSFYCPTGRWPSRGWILMARGEYNLLNKYSTALRLDIGYTADPHNTLPLRNLSIVQAQCVTRGLATDVAALYLVEITDARGVLHNEWFQFPFTKFYNIRVPAYPETFYLRSMNDYAFPPGAGSKTTWTWTTMLRNMWETMPLLGVWPGLPTPVPRGTPEGFWFPGVPAWTALNDVLDSLGLTIACDLTETDNPFTIVRRGATDVAFNVLQTLYNTTSIEDDLEWIDVGAARVPGTVTVIFRRRNTVYGTEEAVAYRNDEMAQQWTPYPFYTVSVSAPVEFTGAVGMHYLWSDFTVRYDDSSNPLVADVVEAALVAQERVTQYYDKIDPARYMTRTYAGALPFVTGSQVDGVCYYQDYRDGDRQGWRTKIVRGPDPPFPEIYRK